jgi:hypothetical protein
VDAGQVHALVLLEQAAAHDAADDARLPDLEHAQLHEAVIEQHAVAGLTSSAARRTSWGSRRPVAISSGASTTVPLSSG